MSLKDSNPKDVAAAGRVPLSLCSPVAEAKWAMAQYCGLSKYGSWNWRIAGVRASVYLDAMKRHIAAFISGETYDPVDGTDHLGNVMACAAILIDAREAGKMTDDRPPIVDMRPAYRECEELAVDLRKRYADRNPRHYTIDDTDSDGPATEPSWQGRAATPIATLGAEVDVALLRRVPRHNILSLDHDDDEDGFDVTVENVVWR